MEVYIGCCHPEKSIVDVDIIKLTKTIVMSREGLIINLYWSCTSNHLLPVTVYVIILRYYNAIFFSDLYKKMFPTDRKTNRRTLSNITDIII
jgi:hypothetical protein